MAGTSLSSRGSNPRKACGVHDGPQHSREQGLTCSSDSALERMSTAFGDRGVARTISVVLTPANPLWQTQRERHCFVCEPSVVIKRAAR